MPVRSVSHAALDFGFSHFSHFSHALRKAFCVAPLRLDQPPLRAPPTYAAQLFSAPIISIHSFVFLNVHLPPKLRVSVTAPRGRFVRAPQTDVEKPRH